MLGFNAHAIDRLIGEVFRLNGAIAAAGDAMTKPYGLSSARWQILGAIEATDGATVSELARRVGVARQSAQRVVTEMAAERIVDLVYNPFDRRAKKVVMTERGRQSYQALTIAWSSPAAKLDAHFGAAALHEITRRMTELREEFRRLAPGLPNGRETEGDSS